MSPRLVRFLIGLALGAALGLGYAWRVAPVTYYDTAPDSLRQDYRADYVLMVAQSYQAEDDLRLAILRLAALGPQAPAQIVDQAITFAGGHAFAPPDIQALRHLADDLRALPSPAGIESP